MRKICQGLDGRFLARRNLGQRRRIDPRARSVGVGKIANGAIPGPSILASVDVADVQATVSVMRTPHLSWRAVRILRTSVVNDEVFVLTTPVQGTAVNLAVVKGFRTGLAAIQAERSGRSAGHRLLVNRAIESDGRTNR
jgi:hypothetical protein